MPWYEHREIIFPIIAIIVILFVFADMMGRAARGLRNRWRRVRKKPHILKLKIPQEMMGRLEELRASCETLSGKPMTIEDLFKNALNTYLVFIGECNSGNVFFTEDSKGNRRGVPLFEEK